MVVLHSFENRYIERNLVLQAVSTPLISFFLITYCLFCQGVTPTS
jgi:hypothetical protein